MKLVKILDRFNGLRYPQEYLCFARGSFYQPLHVYLLAGDFVAEDITASISSLAIPRLSLPWPARSPPSANLPPRFQSPAPVSKRGFEPEDALAWLEMKRIRQQKENGVCIHYYEGTNGTVIPYTFQQRSSRLQNRMVQPKPGNVFLPDNLYKQVQIAYAVPRIISW